MAHEDVSHDSCAICCADLFEPIGSERALLLMVLRDSSGDDLKNVVGVSSEFAMFIDNERVEIDVA